MWENRQTVRQNMTAEQAEKVVFRSLVPAKRSFAITDRMLIDPSVGNLIIKGHTDDGVSYAWFKFLTLTPACCSSRHR